MIVRFRPLGDWPGERTPADTRMSSGRFSAPWPATLRLLERELGHLDATEVVIEAGFTDRDIRLDGWPRADARDPADPGVVISFETADHGPLRYSCDMFAKHWHGDLPGWQANLRAIALGLEALRKVERYGIASRGEQYTGWKQLGSGGPIPMGGTGPGMTRAQAAELLGVHSDANDAAVKAMAHDPDGEMVEHAFRVAAKRLHPDVGGDPDVFRRVQQAREVLTS